MRDKIFDLGRKTIWTKHYRPDSREKIGPVSYWRVVKGQRFSTFQMSVAHFCHKHILAPELLLRMNQTNCRICNWVHESRNASSYTENAFKKKY